MKNYSKLFGAALALLSLGFSGKLSAEVSSPTQISAQIVIYHAPDGFAYQSGEIYRDGRGRYWREGKMYKRAKVYNRPGVVDYYGNYPRREHLPPGQAKKIYGGSARDYAPGQMKKWKNGY